MNMHAFLEKLSKAEEPEGTVVTLTLDVAKSGILPPETRVFLHDRLSELTSTKGPAGEVLRPLAGRIRGFVESHLRSRTQGLYLTAGAAIWEPLELNVSLRNFVHVGRTPFLAPLLEAIDRAPRAYVLASDGNEAVLEEFHLGTWSPVSRIRAEELDRDVERLVSGRAAVSRTGPRTSSGGIGGGKRDRYEQSLEEETERMLAKAAREVAARHSHAPAEAVFLFGDPHASQGFRGHLPTALLDRTRFLGPIPRHEEDLRETVTLALEKRMRDRVEAELLEFHERRAQGHLVAMGPSEVLDHLRVGKVARVFLDCERPVPGAKCEACGSLLTGAPEACSLCGEKTIGVSLAQEVAAHSLRHPPLGITFVPRPAKWLEEAGGMVALLSRKGIHEKR